LIYNIDTTDDSGGYGVLIGSAGNLIEAFNNTIHVTDTSDGYVFTIFDTGDPAELYLRNNIGVLSAPSGNCFGNFDNPLYNMSDNISSDGSAPGTGSFINQRLTDLFRDHTIDDYHIKVDSNAKDTGYDLSSYFTNDIEGNTRPYGDYWDIGCFEATTTLVESTIGTTGDYTTIASWISSKAGDFVLNDEIHKGILIDNTNYDQTSTLTITGATTDRNHYWRLTSDPSVRHTGKEGTGARIRSASNGLTIIDIEDDFIMEYIELSGNTGSYTTTVGVNIDSPNYCKIDSCIIHDVRGGASANIGIWTTGNGIDLDIWNNLIYDIYGDSVGGSIFGISINNGENLINLYNNTVDDIGGYEEGAAYGISLGSFLTWGYNQNNIVTRVTGATASCFYNFSGWANSHNMSSDDTAPGTDYLRGRDDPYIIYADHNNRDYHLVDGSVALNSGIELSSYFTTDYEGDTRPYDTGIWDRGCDEGTPFVTSTSTSSSTTSTSTSTSSTSTSSTSTSITSTSTSSTSTTSTSTTSTSSSTTSTTTTPATSIIDPGGTGDYTSLNNWESNEQRVLTEVEIAKCITSNGSADIGGTVDIHGWTTSFSHYIQIWTDPSESYRHSGIWDDSKYRLVYTGGVQAIRFAESYIRIHGLQIESDHNGIAVYNAVYNKNFYIDYNILKGDGSGVGVSMQVSGAGSTYARIYNNMIYDFSDGFVPGGQFDLCLIYNNTVHNCTDVGIETCVGTGVDTIAKNNISYDNGTDWYLNGGIESGSIGNIGGDNSYLGSAGKNNQTVGFMDTDPGRDYRLAYTDTSAKEYGTDLSSGDPYWNFDDDIAGTTRPVDTNWDSGAHETDSSFTTTSTSSTTSTSTSTSTSSSTTSTTTTI
jgi:hypothetical protein